MGAVRANQTTMVAKGMTVGLVAARAHAMGA
jgi:hypothetical protein